MMNIRDSNGARSSDREYKPLEEYGIVGNLETVALIGRDGAIDWCCFPHVESPSVFARILDNQRGGHFTIQPARSFEALQQYVDQTNVLQTHFQTATGQATMVDFMPVPEATPTEDDESHRTIYRKVTCNSGQIDLNLEFEPRFEYARTVPAVERTRHGVGATGDGETIFLSSSAPLHVSDLGASASITLAEGETRWFVLGYTHEIPDRPTAHQEVLDEVIEYWQNWAHSCSEMDNCPIGGPWHDLAVRSALALKLLIHRETGAICAAPTTSLPEDIGGVRNWDYRYNWIRDSAFTVQALAKLGHLKEVREYFNLCLSHCSHGDPADIQPVYGLHGRDDLNEETLDHLSGYRDSAPVRIGNAAHDQQQLDVYGELIVGVYETASYGETITQQDWEVMQNIINYVCDAWQEPDVGIWEMRDEPQHFVYSKVMCWAALDRGLRIVDETGFEGPVERWRDVRKVIRETVLERGYSDSLNSFVRSFEDQNKLDSATLRIPIVDFLPADDPRMQGTIDAILDRLTTDDGLVDRYEGDDGLPGDEGAFVVSSFWLVNALALAGRTEEATTLFRSMCEYVSPLGLLAEEIDPDTGTQLGNFPQAFSQIGLINSVLSLEDSDANCEPRSEIPTFDAMAEKRASTTYTDTQAGDHQ
ncbi:glycoside hydrolase family 15 protein [Halalkalicoccus salilacus]|uniref:glycoside hydrolase family 15 protein n=2 Tax=Halococcaceae TaxID=1963270 RepID=UPI002F9627A6